MNAKIVEFTNLVWLALLSIAFASVMTSVVFGILMSNVEIQWIGEFAVKLFGCAAFFKLVSYIFKRNLK